MILYIIITIIISLFVAMLLLPVCKAKDISKNQKEVFLFIIIIFFGGGSFFLYHQFGSPEILPLIEQRDKRLLVVKDNITVNLAAIKKNPKNIKAWVGLGDNFVETGQFSAAANAYKQSVLLFEGNPVLIMAYARALIMDADGVVTPNAKKSLDMLLILQPKNEEARYFLAVQKLQSGDKKSAMSEMKELYKSLAGDSPIKMMIDSQIGRK